MPDAVDGAIPIAPISARPRLESIDLLRGIIIVVMALDHVRDFFSHDLISFVPLDLEKTYPALFLTRWITHFCAHVFCFLAGTSAYLSFRRGKTKNDLARFLLSRGLWLVFIELTVLRCFGWNFEFNYRVTGVQVIWALGWSMVALAGLIYLPRWLIAVLAGVMIVGHNATDSVPPAAFGQFAWLWTTLHVPGPIVLSPRFTLLILYPLIPWIGVMAFGYLFGAVFEAEPRARRRQLLWWGIAMIAAFIALRAANVYGDPHAWRVQKNALFTVFDFIKCQKYPPSLLFLLMTLGPAIAALAFFDQQHGAWRRPFIVIGRVPLFFYLLHIPLIHALAIALAYAKYGRADWLFDAPWGQTANQPPSDYGYSLLGVYLVWIIVVAALYPACAWFAGLKQRRRDPWLSYL